MRMFERTKAKIRLRRICKALGVEPYPEMVRYVIDRDETIFEAVVATVRRWRSL
jgi:hypothetical protein